MNWFYRFKHSSNVQIKAVIYNGIHILGNNDQTSVEYFSKTQAMVTYQPTLKQQAELSDGGVSGKFIVQYDIERFNDAGEILVSRTFSSFC